MAVTETTSEVTTEAPAAHAGFWSLMVGSIGVVFGEPLDFSRFAGMEGDRFVLRSITDEIMYELARIGGQEYTDVYATSVKKRKPSRVG